MNKLGLFSSRGGDWSEDEYDEDGIDTLLIAGCTTSGCVRATAVDACAYNFIPIVISDCVGDRAIGPHDSSLFDLDQKYADVINFEEAKKQF